MQNEPGSEFVQFSPTKELRETQSVMRKTRRRCRPGDGSRSSGHHGRDELLLREKPVLHCEQSRGRAGRGVDLGVDVLDVVATVLGEITSRWAISLLGSPRATSLRTSTSRGVRPERHLRRRTEGGAGIARFFWERCRYDWSRAELVTATVIDSNVLEQGSTWELRATPREGGGSDIEMVFAREFRSGARGAIGYTLNRVGGRRLFGLMLRKTLTAIQKSAEKGR